MRTSRVAVWATLGLVLAMLVPAMPAVADCPRYDGDDALRLDRSADGSVGTFSGQFAVADRVARPSDYCAEVDYRPMPGLQGRARRIETPQLSSRSVSVAANGLADSDVDIALVAARRQDAVGNRQAELLQRIVVSNLRQQTRWIHERALDRLVVDGATALSDAANHAVAVRGSVEMLRDRAVSGVTVANVLTEVAFDVAGMPVTAGRSGAPRVGERGTWSLAVGNLFDRAGLQLRRAALSLARAAGLNDRVATAVDATVLGRQIRLEGGSSRNSDWSAGAELSLVDVTAGELKLDIDLNRNATGVERQALLSGQFDW